MSNLAYSWKSWYNLNILLVGWVSLPDWLWIQLEYSTITQKHNTTNKLAVHDSSYFWHRSNRIHTIVKEATQLEELSRHTRHHVASGRMSRRWPFPVWIPKPTESAVWVINTWRTNTLTIWPLRLLVKSHVPPPNCSEPMFLAQKNNA